MSKTYPEIKNCLFRNYGDCMEPKENKVISDYPQLVQFLDNLTIFINLIMEKASIQLLVF